MEVEEAGEKWTQTEGRQERRRTKVKERRDGRTKPRRMDELEIVRTSIQQNTTDGSWLEGE